MRPLQNKCTVKEVKGPRQMTREANETIWARFDRLQHSLKPIRKGQRISRGIHYGRRP